ncbi:ATP-binding protein [Oculatella sp. LEGE 06141]|uniref:two-component system sensor histidine kinase RppB n=1 Tax=Oculatella sp. LEGE 06141 TaxID=1828648 RepID=UPI0018807D13|nr:two-component system sensor histidine kinase RppB [Oculatella sp. LEGE 06141]MBE9182486.1 ATP-binding protein [Oculatella sp. LEGE 06141]
MQKNRLFYQSRLRLASWYAGVMGCILSLCGIGLYQALAKAYQKSIDGGLEAVAQIVDNRIEPALRQPDQLRQLPDNLLFRLCPNQDECLPADSNTQPPLVEAANPVDYYIRLLDPTGKLITVMGVHLEPVTSGDNEWQTITDHRGVRYRQISRPLNSRDQPWGYVQVGRSLNDLDQNLAMLRWTLLLGCPIAVVLVGLSSWWLAGLAMQPVYKTFQQMQQFTADAAHELRTPLAAMQATIESTLRLQDTLKPNSPDSTGALAILQRQTTRLSQLVKDLLLLARLDNRELTKQQRSCCLNDVVNDLLEELSVLAMEAGVILSIDIKVPHSVDVWGDEEQLYRLVFNLINNAIQATPEGGQVKVLLNQTDHTAIIQVQDTGVGIAPEEQHRIFDRFYRVEQDRSRRTGGSGLGLSISQAIAQMHNGIIFVTSELGKGSTFTLYLPLQ